MQEGRKLRAHTLIVGLALLLGNNSAFALRFNSPFKALSSFQRHKKSHAIYIISDKLEDLRFKRNLVPINKAIADILNEQFGHNLLELRMMPPAFQLKDGDQGRSDIKFYARGIPLCGYELKTQVFEDQTAIMIGQLPSLESSQYPSSDWPRLDLAFDIAAKELMTSGYPEESIRLGSHKRCYFVNNGELMPVWHLTLLAGTLPYQSYVDGYEVMHLEKAYFDVSGQALVHPNHILEKEMKRITLDDLTGDGTLTSTDIRMVVPSSTPKAINASHIFEYAIGDARYDETAAFAHAQEHYRFFKKLGFQWYGPKPMDIKIHFAPGGRRNNALFVPGIEEIGTLPTISIDDGDGIVLQNLTRDGDVVSHELGHFIIYQTLKSTDGESLVLHEGLADFFAFLRTGDPCLGESICPAGSSTCWVESQCLRTASNSLVYGDTLWNQLAGTQQRLGHLHGQVISGLLWDLRTKYNMPVEDLARLVMKSISLLVHNSGFSELMMGLLAADKVLFASKYEPTIRNAAKARGLDIGFGIREPSPDSSKKSRTLGCGVSGVTGSALPEANLFFLIILMLLPLAITLGSSKSSN